MIISFEPYFIDPLYLSTRAADLLFHFAVSGIRSRMHEGEHGLSIRSGCIRTQYTINNAQQTFILC